jgi:hypothetical protein
MLFQLFRKCHKTILVICIDNADGDLESRDESIRKMFETVTVPW